jgi:hypothetical protein
MSATIIPWRPRASATTPNSITAQKATVYLPALIDGQVTVNALIEGLASVGLRLQYDSSVGQLMIVPRHDSADEY